MSAFGRVDDTSVLAGVTANYALVAVARQRQGDGEAARKCMDRATEALLSLPVETGITKVMLGAKVVAAQVEIEDLAGARAFVQQLEPPSRSLAEHVAVACAKAGDMAGAVELAEMIPADSRGRGRAWGEVAKALIESDYVDAAQELLAKLGTTSEEAAAFRTAGAALVGSDREAELIAWVSGLPQSVHRAYACLGAAEAPQGANPAAAAR
jgi:hypothetical protein